MALTGREIAIVAGAVVAGAILVALLSKEPDGKVVKIETGTVDQASGNSGRVPNKDGMLILAHKAVEQKLRDPGSAEYRNEKLGSYQSVSVVCGEVNAKNGFGGMTGFERYVSNGGDATVLASQMDAAEFSNVWSQMGC